MIPDRSHRYLRFLGARPDADVDDEIAFHLEMRERELIARGVPPAEARTEARRRFGDERRLRRQMQRLERARTRGEARGAWWQSLQSDLRFVARSLVRQPLFAASVILTLGLSIGANASIFSAVNAYLLKPLPVVHPDRLVAIALAERSSGLIGSVSYPAYREVAQLTTVFDDAVAWMGTEVALRTEREPARGFVLAASPNYFTALGVRAALGRVYGEEDAAARAPVVVLTDAYWSRVFDRDRTVVGRTIHINEIPFTVVGVLPPAFRGTQPLILPDAVIPVDAMAAIDPSMPRNLEAMGWSAFRVLAHLKSGVSVQQARATLERRGDELAAQDPGAFADTRLIIEREIRTRPEFAVARLTPWIAAVFFGMVGLALLVACANVANLLLVRATVRRGEIAVRSALGASVGRVMRLLLVESMVLGVLSLGVAFVVARFCIGWLDTLPLAIDIPVSFGLELDWRVFWYAAAIALLAGVLSGLAPALMGARTPVGAVLRDGGRTGSTGRGRTRTRAALVIAQVAVSFILLVCGGLFLRSARSAAQLDLGFGRSHRLLAQTDLALHRIEGSAARQVQDRFLEGVAALPGVEHAALGTHVPMSGNFNTRTVYIDERPPQLPDGMTSSGTASVSPGYRAALGLQLLAGRDFTPQDDSASPPVALVNRILAETLWPGRDAVGQRLRLRPDGAPVEVVGVVNNAQLILLGERPRLMMYLPLRQNPQRQTFAVVKTRGSDPSALAGSVRRVMSGIDPSVLVYGVRTMDSHLDQGIALFFVNIGATLATAIGVLGLLQTIVGLYGVLSYSVAQRTREFGIRMALGARAGVLMRHVLGQSAALVGTGLVLGGAIAVVGTRTMRNVLVGVSPTDALSFGGALLTVGVLALVSSYIPAWRASRVAPAEVVRGE